MTKCRRGVENTVRIDNLENRMDKFDIIIEKVRNRLPNYWTFIFAGLTGLIGWLIK